MMMMMMMMMEIMMIITISPPWLSGDNKDVNSEGEDSVSDNNNTNSTTSATNKNPMWMLLLVMVLTDDDGKENSGDYVKFCSNYDLNDNGVFDNDNTDNGEGCVCMTVTNSWLPLEDDKYEEDFILLVPSVFDVSGNSSIYPNLFNGTLNDSLGSPY